MSELVLKDYVKNINKLSGKEFLMFIVLHNVSPVIVGVKPSVILTFSKNDRNLYNLWFKHKKYVMKHLELEIEEIKNKEDSVVVIFYNKDNLEQTLNSCENKGFLKKLGYEESCTVEQKINILKDSFQNMCPHEVGIFLGYPFKDVKTFMEAPNTQHLLCGYWKVYHEPEKAKLVFQKYDYIKDKVINLFSHGWSMEQIIDHLKLQCKFYH